MLQSIYFNKFNKLDQKSYLDIINPKISLQLIIIKILTLTCIYTTGLASNGFFPPKKGFSHFICLKWPHHLIIKSKTSKKSKLRVGEYKRLQDLRNQNYLPYVTGISSAKLFLFAQIYSGRIFFSSFTLLLLITFFI